MKDKMKFIFGILLLAIITATTGNAQDKALAEVIRSSEKIVKGAPFSAEAVSESIQSLSDGNKITRRTATKMYRDSEGRFRRDELPNPGGILGAVVGFPQTLFIIDPVEGLKFYLDTTKKTVRQANFKSNTNFNFDFRAKTEDFRSKIEKEKKEIENKKVVENEKKIKEKEISSEKMSEEREKQLKKAQENKEIDQQQKEKRDAEIKAKQKNIANKKAEISEKSSEINAKRAEMNAKRASINGNEAAKNTKKVSSNPVSPGATKTEELGIRNIEGLEATGTRTITTIAAGKIGNERPIDIVYERWYSKDLQLIVFSKHSDPRFGEQTYRLTNINRNEPERTIFALPADYKVLNPFPPKSPRPPNVPKSPSPKEKP